MSQDLVEISHIASPGPGPDLFLLAGAVANVAGACPATIATRVSSPPEQTLK